MQRQQKSIPRDTERKLSGLPLFNKKMEIKFDRGFAKSASIKNRVKK